jgi:hypothetical protein
LTSYVQYYDTEISGCGLVEKIERRTKNEDKDKPDVIMYEFKIIEVFLPSEQDNNGASTDIKSDQIHKIMTKLIQEGKEVEKLKLHWHSHANMDVFHSATDEDNYDTLNNSDFLVSLVLNHRGDMLGRIDYFYPIQISLVHIPIYVLINVNEELDKKIKLNIEELDKYVNKTKETLISGDLAGRGNWKDMNENSWWNIEARAEKKIRKQVGHKMGLTKEQRSKFTDCEIMKCEQCSDIGICQSFNWEVDDLLMTTRRNNIGY